MKNQACVQRRREHHTKPEYAFLPGWPGCWSRNYCIRMDGCYCIRMDGCWHDLNSAPSRLLNFDPGTLSLCKAHRSFARFEAHEASVF
jgi:hypothetical protein